jgi:hypothetical protein
MTRQRPETALDCADADMRLDDEFGFAYERDEPPDRLSLGWALVWVGTLTAWGMVLYWLGGW